MPTIDLVITMDLDEYNQLAEKLTAPEQQKPRGPNPNNPKETIFAPDFDSPEALLEQVWEGVVSQNIKRPVDATVKAKQAQIEQLQREIAEAGKKVTVKKAAK